MSPDRPLVVVVTGAPGTGKTTLARVLGDALHLPVLSRDVFKSGLHVTYQVTDPAETRRFAEAAFTAFFDAAGLLVEHKVSLVAEAALQSAFAGPELERLGEGADLVVVRCTCDTALAAARFRARAERGERHPAHADLAYADEMDAGAFDWSRYDPFELAVPTIVVATDDGYEPGLAAIVRFVGAA